MKLSAILLFALGAATFSSQTHAATGNFLPSNGAYAPGDFSVMFDGLTDQTYVTFRMQVTTNFPCTFDFRATPPPGPQNCQSQFVQADITAPGEFGLFSYAGILHVDNASPPLGSGLQYSDDDGGVVTLTPDNSVLNLRYSGLAGAEFVSSLLFSLYYTEGSPVVLSGSMPKGDGVGSDVPLPAGFPLLAAGIGALVTVSRRRSRKV
jgi:hypothetical protein